jgi:molybdenum cofactor cytidylyltransferase
MPAIGAIVLAAGTSQRFGADNKLLASIGGEPLVRRVVHVLIQSGIADIVVVTGHERTLIQAALEALPVGFAHNENWATGMASSIVAGVSALPAGVDGAFIVPGDMPFLTAAVIERLTEVFDEHGRASIVYPATSGGEQRNPVLWPRRFFGELAALAGPQGAKQLLATLAPECIAVAIDDHAFADIDTEADLVAARARLGT